MKVGDLVLEKSKMKRECSLGVILDIKPYTRGPVHEDDYLVHFFDDNQVVWMLKHHLEVVSESR